MIRDARSGDRHELFVAARALAKKHYEERHVDVERLANLVKELTDGRNFAQVVESAGEVKGALLAFTQDHMWAQRRQSHVLLWYSEVPGAGIQLLRNYVKWVKSQRGIRIAGLQPDFDIDPRALKVASRLGFKQRGGAWLLYN